MTSEGRALWCTRPSAPGGAGGRGGEWCLQGCKGANNDGPAEGHPARRAPLPPTPSPSHAPPHPARGRSPPRSARAPQTPCGWACPRRRRLGSERGGRRRPGTPRTRGGGGGGSGLGARVGGRGAQCDAHTRVRACTYEAAPNPAAGTQPAEAPQAPAPQAPSSHLARACRPHHVHDLAHGGAAHDRVIHQQHALASKHRGHGVELAAHRHLRGWECVCVCGWVGGWVGGCGVRECVWGGGAHGVERAPTPARWRPRPLRAAPPTPPTTPYTHTPQQERAPTSRRRWSGMMKVRPT